MSRLDSYLAPLLPAFPANLLTSESADDILRLAETLPGVLAFSTLGFECMLADARPALDFLVTFNKAQHGPRHLSTLAEKQEQLEHPAWQAVSALADRWSTPGDPLSDGVDDIWLEFDIAGGGQPLPSIFAGPVWRHQGHERSHETMATIIHDCLNVLLDDDVHLELREQIDNAVFALPPGGRIFQIGAMKSRPTRRVRLCIHEMSADQIVPYLTAIGHTDTEAVEELVKWVFPRVNTIALAIDVGTDVHPKLGLECYLDHTDVAARPARWQALLKSLTALGASRPEKATAVLDFPGHQEILPDDQRWPREVTQLSEFLGNSRRSVFARELHHVKLVHDPGKPMLAKAYLSLRHRWIS